MTLTGIALLPDEYTRDALINFRHEIDAHVAGPRFGEAANLPHLSIFQSWFKESNPVTVEHLRTVTSSLDSGTKPQSILTEISTQSLGWVQARTPTQDWMNKLQAATLQISEPLLDPTRFNLKKKQSGLSKTENANLKKYGYRFIGEEFRPHFTLGRTLEANREVDDSVLDSFYKHLAGHPFLFTEIVYYQVGKHGALEEILERITIP